MGAQHDAWEFLHPGKTFAETLNLSHQTLLYVEGVSVSLRSTTSPSTSTPASCAV